MKYGKIQNAHLLFHIPRRKQWDFFFFSVKYFINVQVMKNMRIKIMQMNTLIKIFITQLECPSR